MHGAVGTIAEPPVDVPVDIDVPPELVRIGRARITGAGTHRYYHTDYWALHLYFAAGNWSIAGRPFSLVPGSIGLTPARCESRYETDEDLGHIFVHFAPRRPARNSEAEGHPGAALPLHVPPGPTSEPIAATIVAALTAFRDDRLLSRAKLWGAIILLSRLGGVERPSPATHGAVERARTWIDLHLPEPCTLERLADEAGVSATHLNRLFTQAHGTSAMRYVRNRRMELAHYLLIATDLAVKEIAYQVGIPDLHAFNKLCKAYFGAPPRSVRESPGAAGSSGVAS